MLNTPKYTLGIQDIAKCRALLFLVRTLEDDNFSVHLQLRAGLDYFAPDLDKAKVQLAEVTALMDDIEPNDDNSPEIIHVVSYSEAVRLATPDIINESIKSSILFRTVMTLWGVYCLMLIVAQFTDMFYYATPDNQYYRGSLYALLLVPLILIMILDIVGVIRRRKKLSKKGFTALLIYLLPMTIAMIIRKPTAATICFSSC